MKTPEVFAIPRDPNGKLTIDDLYAQANGYMNSRWEEHHEIAPMWICASKEALIVVVTPWENEADKAQAIGFLRRMFDTMRIESYAFMTEAWMAVVKPGMPDDLTTKMPMDRPDRKEVVMLNAFEKSGENSREAFFDIVRKEGRSPYLIPSKDMAGLKGLQGRMFNLFNPIRKSN